ncbi:hypothetical protein HER10_EVM0001241 [Colletotrichum scovillei]|uniref:uncharacterized protein n=1 Tax=Colletotrichum scovillei TaxID=1209932 RepID=UPI0015C3AA7A|nr:uncharacterized protein HER10_EVM0001241 [Colletotrichum scovillei]KAF4779129.1 hypothetical protein HER10_EVM0001241 [Colletotrichum scovillei]
MPEIDPVSSKSSIVKTAIMSAQIEALQNYVRLLEADPSFFRQMNVDQIVDNTKQAIRALQSMEAALRDKDAALGRAHETIRGLEQATEMEQDLSDIRRNLVVIGQDTKTTFASVKGITAKMEKFNVSQSSSVNEEGAMFAKLDAIVKKLDELEKLASASATKPDIDSTAIHMKELREKNALIQGYLTRITILEKEKAEIQSKAESTGQTNHGLRTQQDGAAAQKDDFERRLTETNERCRQYDDLLDSNVEWERKTATAEAMITENRRTHERSLAGQAQEFNSALIEHKREYESRIDKLTEALERTSTYVTPEAFSAEVAIRQKAEADLTDSQATLRGMESTLKAERGFQILVKGTEESSQERHQELMTAIARTLIPKEMSRRRARSSSPGRPHASSDHDALTKLQSTPWCQPVGFVIQSFSNFDVSHDEGSRTSVNHGSIFRNIAHLLSESKGAQAFQAFLEYSAPDNTYCLIAAIKASEGRPVLSLSATGHCLDHEGQDGRCILTKCETSADGAGKSYIVLRPQD